jgi:hypothetical protein
MNFLQLQFSTHQEEEDALNDAEEEDPPHTTITTTTRAAFRLAAYGNTAADLLLDRTGETTAASNSSPRRPPPPPPLPLQRPPGAPAGTMSVAEPADDTAPPVLDRAPVPTRRASNGIRIKFDEPSSAATHFIAVASTSINLDPLLDLVVHYPALSVLEMTDLFSSAVSSIFLRALVLRQQRQQHQQQEAATPAPSSSSTVCASSLVPVSPPSLSQSAQLQELALIEVILSLEHLAEALSALPELHTLRLQTIQSPISNDQFWASSCPSPDGSNISYSNNSSNVYASVRTLHLSHLHVSCQSIVTSLEHCFPNVQELLVEFARPAELVLLVAEHVSRYLTRAATTSASSATGTTGGVQHLAIHNLGPDYTVPDAVRDHIHTGIRNCPSLTKLSVQNFASVDSLLEGLDLDAASSSLQTVSITMHWNQIVPTLALLPVTRNVEFHFQFDSVLELLEDVADNQFLQDSLEYLSSSSAAVRCQNLLVTGMASTGLYGIFVEWIPHLHPTVQSVRFTLRERLVERVDRTDLLKALQRNCALQHFACLEPADFFSSAAARDANRINNNAPRGDNNAAAAAPSAGRIIPTPETVALDRNRALPDLVARPTMRVPVTAWPLLHHSLNRWCGANAAPAIYRSLRELNDLVGPQGDGA